MTTQTKITLCLFIFLTIGAVVTFNLDNTAITLWISDKHFKIGDLFFQYWTHLGDGLIFIPVLLWMFTQRWRYFIMTALAAIFHMVGVFLSKEVYFRGQDWLRPGGVIDHELLNLVDGVEIHSSYTFPSGHTATAFLVAGCFVYIFKSKRIWSIYLYAVLVGISRVYLYQHWFKDIWAGAALGVGSVLLAVLIVSFFGQWADKRLMNFGRAF